MPPWRWARAPRRPTRSGDGLGGALKGVGSGAAPVEHLQLDPLAKTGVDPLTNTVGVKPDGASSLGTGNLTKPLTNGASLSDLPLVGRTTALAHK